MNELIDLAIDAWSNDAFTTVDPTLSNISIPPNTPWYCSVGLNPASTSSSQQAGLVITTDQGVIRIGVRTGTKRYRVGARVTSITLDTGASGGLISVWIDPCW